MELPPPKSGKEPDPVVSFRCPKELLQRIDSFAKKHSRSRTEILVFLLQTGEGLLTETAPISKKISSYASAHDMNSMRAIGELLRIGLKNVSQEGK